MASTNRYSFFCQFSDACVARICQNTATCSGSGSNFQCDCVAGTSGTYCQVNPDDCRDDSCENGGCVDGFNTIMCNCNGTGYMGVRCADDVDECTDDGACNGRGECTNTRGSYECACRSGYSGGSCSFDGKFSLSGRVQSGVYGFIAFVVISVAVGIGIGVYAFWCQGVQVMRRGGAVRRAYASRSRSRGEIDDDDDDEKIAFDADGLHVTDHPRVEDEGFQIIYDSVNGHEYVRNARQKIARQGAPHYARL